MAREKEMGNLQQEKKWTLDNARLHKRQALFLRK
jgi:hypothetical protein